MLIHRAPVIALVITTTPLQVITMVITNKVLRTTGGITTRNPIKEEDGGTPTPTTLHQPRRNPSIQMRS
jgi:hypothetical protein